MIYTLLRFCGTDEVILGITSLLGIVGFVLTVIVSLRTSKISRILKYNEVTSLYNRERTGFKNAFEGHRKSIAEDGIQTNSILKAILQNVEEYRAKFGEIFSIKERVTLWCFIRLLKKDASDTDFNKICNYLAILSGRLGKKEATKHG